jgi:hypothetical protein
MSHVAQRREFADLLDLEAPRREYCGVLSAVT